MKRVMHILAVVTLVTTPCVVMADPPIERIRFSGLHTITEQEVLALLSSRPGDPLDSGRVAADVRALWELGAFSDIRVSSDREDGLLVLTFALTEHPRVRTARLDVYPKGRNREVSIPIDLADLQANSAYLRKVFCLALKWYFVDRGYYFARVTSNLVQHSEGLVDARFAIHSGPRTVIRSIKFAGNLDIPDEDLVTLIEGGEGRLNRPGGTYNPDHLSHGLRQIIAHFHDHGKVDAVVHPPVVELCTPFPSLPTPDKRLPLQEGDEAICISIYVDEGPTYRFGHIGIAGLPDDLRKQVVGQLYSRTGTVFSLSKIRKDVTRIETLCSGWAVTTLVDHVNTESRTVDLVFQARRRMGTGM